MARTGKGLTGSVFTGHGPFAEGVSEFAGLGGVGADRLPAEIERLAGELLFHGGADGFAGGERRCAGGIELKDAGFSHPIGETVDAAAGCFGGEFAVLLHEFALDGLDVGGWRGCGSQRQGDGEGGQAARIFCHGVIVSKNAP